VEILEQIRFILADNPGLDASRHPKLKIHFARMGEPSLNPGTLEALLLLAWELPYPGILPSLSTVAPKSPSVTLFFEELAAIKERHFSGGRFQLQFSLHATDEEKRRRIVPIRKWSLEDVARYGERFWRQGDRRITLNFAPARGEVLEAGLLGRLFDPGKFLVKLTPVNPTRRAKAHGADFPWTEAPEPFLSWARELEGRGFKVILSPSLPEEIEAETSCGQLWSAALKERATVSVRSHGLERLCYVRPDGIEEKARTWMRALGRGREIPLEVRSAALLVVDLQEFFLSPASPAYLPQARVILRNAKGLVDVFRKIGRPVFFIQHAHEDPSRDGGLMTLWWRKVCMAGSQWSRISSLLGPREGEIFRKCRYSAFSNRSLEDALRGQGVKALVVTGIVTNLCVESTVRDAFDLGFKSFVAADATAAHTEEMHVASLKTLAQGFSSVALTRELLARIEDSGCRAEDSRGIMLQL
jgi:23S rRNA (adenine2503-C2)-methyltransferase